MTRNTTKIELPPPRMIRPDGGSRFPRWVTLILIFLALIIGVGAGVYFGVHYNGKQDRGSAIVEVANSVEAKERQEEINRQLAEARVAVAEGDWFRARELFQGIK